MKIDDRITHNHFGTGTIIAIRNYERDLFNNDSFPYLILFDESLRQIWVRGKDIEKIKVRKLVK